MKIDEKIKIISLFDIYGGLLKDKEQDIFRLYYFEDLSIIEIAQEKEVSKNAIFKALKKTYETLSHYEEVLKIMENKNYNEQVLLKNNVNIDIIKQIK